MRAVRGEYAMIERLLGGWLRTRRALGFFATEIRGMHAAAYVLAASALFSSLLALMRDRILANLFGAGTELDLYYAAFRIPDLLFVAAGALVSVYMLIPMLSSRSEEEGRRYIDTVVTGFSLLALLGCAIAYFAAPALLRFLFPNFAEEALLGSLIPMTRILLLQPVLLGFSNIVAAVTQFRHRYLLYAMSPIVYNVGIILGALLFYPLWGLSGLVWGVVLGAALHLGIQLPPASADGFFKRLSLADVRGFFETVRLSVPRALALSATQLSFLGFLALAGGLTTGSISVFMFAFNLQAVPLAIIGASYSVAAFPSLAAMIGSGQSERFVAHVSAAARHVLFWSLPAMALMIVLRAHVVRTILGSGEFDWTDTRLTAAAFALFGISLVAQAITLLLVRGYYASGRTLVPVLVAAGTTIVALSLGVLFLYLFDIPAVSAFLEALFRVTDVPGSQVLALPLAFSIAAILGALALTVDFQIRFGSFLSGTLPALWEGTVAAFACGVSAYAVLTALGPVTLASTLASVFLRGGISGLVGIGAAAFAYYFLDSRELSEVLAAFRRTLLRKAEPYTSAE